jgi:4-hydroxy-tetrahydrodipicolinate synthase
MDALFVESNPIPLKALLHHLQICGDGVRLPLVPASEGTRRQLVEAWRLAAE